MRVSDTTVEQLLIASKKIKKEDVGRLQEQVKAEKKPLQDIAIASNLISESDLTKLYADEIEIPFIDLNPKELDREIMKQIPERIARKYNVVLFQVDEDQTKHLAMEDPDDVQAVDFLQKQIGKNIRVYISTKPNILAGLDQYRGNIGSEITSVLTDNDEDAEAEDVSEEDLAEDSPIAQTVNLIVEYAIKAGASDIHIEPREKHVQVRYRIDGVLKEANKLPKKVMAALVSRIKILSNLKIDERRAPQDGRFKIDLNGRVFAFRVSTLPVTDGEKVVMRVLDESTEPLSLKKLGFWGPALNVITNSIAQPHGMLLVTGPTGSGKSTTLQSVLNILNKPDVNISTVEDPVEYKLIGVNQTQVNVKAGMTFINGLRALLRQDPNIIMVGEIRDSETAGLGIQAALTGHLVFSTLHTNNAATCLPRLLDMGIEPFLIASTVHAVVGQRLVRRVNLEECELFVPEGEEMKEIESVFGIKSRSDWERILKMASAARKYFEMEPSSKIEFLRPKKGLEKGQTGYKGRMGIYEVLDVNTDIEKLIVANATADELQHAAVKGGMITMQLDGLVKSLLGMTTIEEILRVTRE